MKQLFPEKQRQFALEVVRQLRDHGHQAYWAGGCVRDHLLNRAPSDFDVATSAHPEEIRGVFRHRKTIAIGAAFGVMTVVGPRGAGQVEVTTFRHDVSYSDGRHPDRIAFSSPEEDARRRDFTINGMFFDPLEEKVIDFVGGEADLRQGILRAIGDPQERFTEDKLRMLRAVRFTSVLDFRLEEQTRTAISDMAPQITVVSAERIADEMRTMLVHPECPRAVELLLSTGLLREILPEAAAVATADDALLTADLQPAAVRQPATPWQQTLAMLGSIETPSFALSLAVLLHAAGGVNLAETIGQRWRLARSEIDRAAWLLAHQCSLSGARKKPWSQLQPLLIHEAADELLKFHAARAVLGLADIEDVAYCRQELIRPPTDLDPPVLVTGDDLIAQGIPRGPIFAQLLQAVRTAQLDGIVRDRPAALDFIRQAWHQQSSTRP